MNATTGQLWQTEFGLAEHGDSFLATKADLNRVARYASQAHVARRAFDLLKLDGVLCTDTAPLVYFKQVTRIDNAQIAVLHRMFWNHGGAPILAVIAPHEVHIYSGFVRPTPAAESAQHVPAFVKTLERASSELRTFLPAVASGEFLRKHSQSFDLSHRVDSDLLANLQATREQLLALPSAHMDANALDPLLCRLVFSCYLFDRCVIGATYLKGIGLPNAAHLRDVLELLPRTRAKKYLYRLFARLGKDFNGDLFNDELESEAQLVSDSHIACLSEFFRATDAVTGQQSFWPYDFAAIPVETISAIYERFLKVSDQRDGAFYTPRFVAELVLDIALNATSSLLNSRYLDPACGSGIFLVGLFNRIAEEWTRANPDARNERRATELRRVLCENLCGIDINPTACRITTFSLYLAYLDQLSPRDIQELREKGHRLPKLVRRVQQAHSDNVEGNIWCGNFFSDAVEYPTDVDVVVGNPPWASTAKAGSPAAVWCSNSTPKLPVPDKQIAAAFVWKACRHVNNSGRVCFALPHGTLFNRSNTALEFQRMLFRRHAVDHVMNLADYQRFLFNRSGHPAIVVCYRKSPPGGPQHEIQYSSPKVDWLVTRSEVVAVAPEDQGAVTIADVLGDLESQDAPQIWKQRVWATPRDRRLIDRLLLYPRLRDHVRQIREIAPAKPWLVSAGVQDVAGRDDPAKAETIALPSKLFIDARSAKVDWFLLPRDCRELPAAEYTVRSGSNKATTVFHAPHVLVNEGFTWAAYADFDVSFLFALRGFSGPPQDRNHLIFLAAYFRTALAKFLLFHTSSSWGISRQRVGVDELLRLPFPVPEALPDPGRARRIIEDVAEIVIGAMGVADDAFIDRGALLMEVGVSIETLMDEYFDILPVERILIEDTVRVIIPSTRPTRDRRLVPTITPSTEAQRAKYTRRLAGTLNEWAKKSRFLVEGRAIASASLGIGVAILEKNVGGPATPACVEDDGAVMATLERLRRLASRPLNALELMRGIRVFEQERLYIVKPIGRRFWTETAALNDADQVAGSILMQHSGAMA